MKLHIVKTLLLIIFFFLLKNCPAQEITYFDWGFAKVAYDADSVVMEEKLIRVRIINKFETPFESDYGMTDKTIFNIEIYGSYYIIRSKIFFLTSGDKKDYNIPETYNYSETENRYIYRLKNLLIKEYMH
jgi:hypothetical protein